MSDFHASVRANVRENLALDQPFVLTNLCATIIACCGLVADSAAVIVGAMVVATLVAPITGTALALVDGDDRLLRRALGTLTAGVALVFATGVAFGTLYPHLPPGREILARTAPNLLDLLVALVSGAIGAYAMQSSRLNSALVGVAIAVALVPPLSAAGILASLRNWESAAGALLLVATNVVAIHVGALLGLWLCGFRGVLQDSTRRHRGLLRTAFSMAVLIALASVLAVHTVRLTRQATYEANVRQALEQAVSRYPGAYVLDARFIRGARRLVLEASLIGPKPLDPGEVDAVERALPAPPSGIHLEISLRHLGVDAIAGASPPK